MHKLGGNTTATLYSKNYKKSDIGEKVIDQKEIKEILGWLDVTEHKDKDTNNFWFTNCTHVFLCDYEELEGIEVKNNEDFLIIGKRKYNIIYVDNCMNVGHYEIFLKELM